LDIDVDNDQLDCIVDRGRHEYGDEVIEERGEKNAAEQVYVEREPAAA